MPALIKYGWTRTKIASVGQRNSVTFEGGQVDGLSYSSPEMKDAKPGEEWLVKIAPCPPFAFGKVEEAKRVEARRDG